MHQIIIVAHCVSPVGKLPTQEDLGKLIGVANNQLTPWLKEVGVKQVYISCGEVRQGPLKERIALFSALKEQGLDPCKMNRWGVWDPPIEEGTTEQRRVREALKNDSIGAPTALLVLTYEEPMRHALDALRFDNYGEVLLEPGTMTIYHADLSIGASYNGHGNVLRP
jgi:hypothetical protein